MEMLYYICLSIIIGWTIGGIILSILFVKYKLYDGLKLIIIGESLIITGAMIFGVISFVIISLILGGIIIFWLITNAEEIQSQEA